MVKNKKPKLVIVGKGAFGDLMAKHLRPYFTVRFIRRNDTDISIKKKLSEVYTVIYSVPMGGLEQSIKRTKSHVPRETIIIDVTSVKVKPLRLLKKYFKGYEILGTHPIFGPQSVKKNSGSLSGLLLVLCNETCTDETYRGIKRFCEKTLDCKIIEQTAKQHDHEMAHVQGLSHFIGRALKHIDIKDFSTSTESYRQLIELKRLLQEDSWGLFETIQNTNNEARKVRKKFLDELHRIERDLHG